MIKVFLDIEPPKATHQSGLTILKRGSRTFIGKKSSSKGAQAKRMLATLLNVYRPQKPLEGPLKLKVHWCYSWRKSEPKKERERGWKYCHTRPDSDNLCKSLKDVLTDCGYFNDDAQVAHLEFIKTWGDKPGISIEITEIA